MPTDTSTPPLRARNVAIRIVAWSLGIFGILRLPSVQGLVLLPVTQLQGSLAMRLFGTPSLPIEVTLACSGADAIAVCIGFILGYPARWRARIAAAAGGVVIILALNTLRIGTLGRATSAAAFDALHLYLWPAVLILVIAGYVLIWMQRVDVISDGSRVVTATPILNSPARPFTITRSFLLLAATLLVAFTAAAPFYLDSGAVLARASIPTDLSRTSSIAT